MPSINRRRWLAGSLSLAAGPGRAEVLTEDWSGDVSILRRAWGTLHPGLYRYARPADVSARFDRLEDEWRRPSAFRDRFRALSELTASVRCGHTYPNPFNSPAAVVEQLCLGRCVVPFRFRWTERGMTVTEDQSAEQRFPRGAVIEAIDGASTATLLSKLRTMARADGSNDLKRTRLMEVKGDTKFEAFDLHLPLVLPVADVAEFRLTDGSVVKSTLLTLAERQAGRSGPAGSAASANPWAVDVEPNGIRRLTMRTWALFNSTFAWEAWLGAFMDDLDASRARGLIVDLRGNEGGMDCGNVILSRLIDRDLPLSSFQRWTRYRSAPQDLRPFLDTWDRSFLDWGDAARPSAERPGFYRLTRYDDEPSGSVIRPAGRRFHGPVAIICDASNSSATFQFAQTVQESGVATLVGEPTGGNRRGINGGAFFLLRLPTSKLEVDLPLIATMPRTPQPDAPVLPNVRIALTAEDVATGRDPQLLTARRVLEEA